MELIVKISTEAIFVSGIYFIVLTSTLINHFQESTKKKGMKEKLIEGTKQIKSHKNALTNTHTHTHERFLSCLYFFLVKVTKANK